MTDDTEASDPYRRVGVPRDPARIREVLELLRVIWETHPDWRLGQLLGNVTSKHDLYYFEDTELLSCLQAALKRYADHAEGCAVFDGLLDYCDCLPGRWSPGKAHAEGCERGKPKTCDCGWGGMPKRSAT